MINENPYKPPESGDGDPLGSTNHLATLSFCLSVISFVALWFVETDAAVIGLFLVFPALGTAVVASRKRPRKRAILSLCLSVLVLLYLPTVIRSFLQ